MGASSKIDRVWNPLRTVPNREKVAILLDEEELLKPLKWRKPKKIFPCSMTDWCADFVTDEMRDRMMAIAALCPQHMFLFLTKRAERCAEYFSTNRPLTSVEVDVMAQAAHTGKIVWDARGSNRYMYFGCGKIGDISNRRPWPGFPLPNVLLGFSAENQECFDARWGHMRKLAAAGWKVWCSAEPLLSAVDIGKAVSGINPHWTGRADDEVRTTILSWIVVGGESGHGARPMNVAWVRSIIRQCRDSGTACFVKQMGAKPYAMQFDPNAPAFDDEQVFFRLKDRKGGDMSEWAEDLRVREYPK